MYTIDKLEEPPEQVDPVIAPIVGGVHVPLNGVLLGSPGVSALDVEKFPEASRTIPFIDPDPPEKDPDTVLVDNPGFVSGEIIEQPAGFLLKLVV